MLKGVFLFFIFATIGFVGVFSVSNLLKKQSEPKKNITLPSPTVTPFSFQKPPKDSLIGTLSVFGDVSYQSRIATEPAKISSDQPIKQGERVVTATGSAMITFPKEAILHLDKKTDIDIVQTLPANVVFTQHIGSIDYQRLGGIPLSIRAEHLLIDENKGEIGVTVDDENNNISINVISGSVTLAYNDINYETHVASISAVENVDFDDTKRKLRIY